MCRLPAFFSDGMVIGKKAKIWGWASSGQKVPASFRGKEYEANADENGRFEFVLESENYGGPFSLNVADAVINDVHVGRVWLCGGQSNMEGPLVRTRALFNEYVVNDPRIRIFQVEKGLKFDGPADDVIGKWNTAEGDFLNNMYAVPYFFARKLLEDLPNDGVPIGLLCNPAGGTPIQGWLPEEIIKDFPEYYESLVPVKEPDYVEKATAEAEKITQTWYSELEAKDMGIAEGWHNPEYDDSGWETRVLLDFDDLPEHGAVWLRKRVNLFATKLNGPVTLRFGRVENNVKVYVNGTEVAEVTYMYPPCTCVIPKNLLVDGENIIAVRIIGDGNKPKIVPGKKYALEYAGGYIDLTGKWRRRIGAVMPKIQPGAWFYNTPCGVYNYMMAPVLGYSVEGLIWYQGESNTGQPTTYKSLCIIFAEFIRKHFGENLPIIFTQLANYVDPPGARGKSGAPGENWAELREQQRKCLEIPNTAMAVAIDCGEWNDLHPTDKKTVGERLALHALRMVYKKDIVSDGPTVDAVKYDSGWLEISFKHGEGLWAKNGHPVLDVFDKSDNVQRIYASIKGKTLTAFVVPEKPVSVRFGWVDCPAVTLYNAYGLPASPFEIEVLP